MWGAGGSSWTNADNTISARSGYGGYSVGVANLTKSKTIYINVGQMGALKVNVNSFNGGGHGGYVDGTGSSKNSSGGGASHIALVSGQLKDLSAHATNGNILVVAGGGGGFTNWAQSAQIASGGDGGGYVGNNGSHTTTTTLYTTGGNQSSGGIVANIQTEAWGDNGSFGQGGVGGTHNIRTNNHKESNGGGGGGYYGGGAGVLGSGTIACGAGGGSGYIGSSNLISGGGITKHMTCYSCTTSTTAATRTNSNTNVSATATADYSKTGNGYARITWLGDKI